MSEVGTKLDLARAYIDMGDPEGARSILDEVLKEALVLREGRSAIFVNEPAEEHSPVGGTAEPAAATNAPAEGPEVTTHH